MHVSKKGQSTGTSKAGLPLMLCQQHLLPCHCHHHLNQQARHCHPSCCHRMIHAGVTTLTCRAAKVTFLGKLLHKPASHSPVMGPCGLQEKGPWLTRGFPISPAGNGSMTFLAGKANHPPPPPTCSTRWPFCCYVMPG